MTDDTPVRRRKPTPAEAAQAFRARLAELGVTLTETRWLGSGKPHQARCAANHECWPVPNKIQQGRGACGQCAGNVFGAGEALFRKCLAELGATLLEPAFLGARKPHHVRCAANHDCWPMPTNVNKGRGICKECAGQTASGAEERFRARLASFGAELLGRYKDNSTPVLVRCAAGHEYLMSWMSLQNSTGPCRICAGHDPATAEAAFRAALAAAGATLVESSWLGSATAHHVICAQGHDCYPWPTSILSGRGFCLTCAGMNPVVAQQEFRDRLAALGATPLFTEWNGGKAKYPVRCKNQHDCLAMPNKVQQGRGICLACTVDWDCFYVVTSPGSVKFGITSGDPRGRLAVHARHGYRTIERVCAGLPGTTALDTENAVRMALKMNGHEPFKGREYFARDCLRLILHVTDSRLGAPAMTQDELFAI